MDRLYTRAEAEALLPQLSEWLTTLQRDLSELERVRQQLATIPAAARTNGHAQQTEALERQAQRLVDRLNQTIALIEERGVEIKDPQTGLVDFRALRAGRVVYLCWRLGEPRISFWHELDAGFAGRQPLD